MLALINLYLSKVRAEIGSFEKETNSMSCLFSLVFHAFLLFCDCFYSFMVSSFWVPPVSMGLIWL